MPRKKGQGKGKSKGKGPGGRYKDKTTGKIRERRYGLRIDDDVEVYIIAGDMLRTVKGRVLDYKKDLHLVDEDGFYHKISFDWVADIIVLAHNRPHPLEDPELKRPKAPQPVVEKPPEDHAYS
jgi:hypothetical protein